MSSDHYALVSSSGFPETAGAAEEILRKGGFAFVQNKTKDLVEFEIEKPTYYRIVIQKRTDPEVGNFLLPSIKAARGCNIDVWLSNAESDSGGSAEQARGFLKELVALLPAPPWEGLKFRESGKAKKKWKDLLD